MSLKNTERSYGIFAKWFHWAMAVLFFASYFSVYYRHWFTELKTPENWNALQLHLSIGVSIGVIVMLRIIWRGMNKKPQPEPGSKIAHLSAEVGHYALYGVMIIMPLTGYLGTGADVEFFFQFDIPKFEDTRLFSVVVIDGMGLTFEEFEAPLDFIHKDIGGAWLVWLLILGHASAALYHHFIKGDRTIIKMT